MLVIAADRSAQRPNLHDCLAAISPRLDNPNLQGLEVSWTFTISKMMLQT